MNKNILKVSWIYYGILIYKRFPGYIMEYKYINGSLANIMEYKYIKGSLDIL